MDARTDHSMPRFAVRRRLAAALIGLATILLAGGAFAETTRVTFLLVNDIYLMSDQMAPDGQRRGGFARLAAVVKAERAKQLAERDPRLLRAEQAKRRRGAILARVVYVLHRHGIYW